ncbi:MAG: wax ester/triacylglycerol synthase domain-containing protein, partial [Acidimicrobiia bacterium]
MRRLSESDAAVLYADRPYAQNLLAPIGIYDPSTAPGGSVSFDDVLRFVGGRLDVARSFRERIVPVPFGLDRPNWAVDDDFDLEYHIRHIALPDPGDWSQLCTQVARIVARPLDMSRAPWELYVIERLGGIAGTAPGAFAVLLKLHHAAVDGATGAEIFTALHDTSPHRHTHRAAVALDDETSTDPLSLLVRAGIRAMVRPITALGTALPKIVRVVPGLVSEIRNGPEPSRTDLLTASPFNGQIGAHRSFGAVTVPLRTVKRIRSAVPGATVHDVTLAVVSGALRALLDERGDLPQASMLALTPISVHGTRGGDGDPHRPGGDVHRFRMAIASLATHLADPLARLQVIQHCTQVARERGAISAPSLLD